jgi:hypothetical protein
MADEQRIRDVIEEIVAAAGLPTREARDDLRRELAAHFEEGSIPSFGSPRAIGNSLRKVHLQTKTSDGGGIMQDVRFGFRMLRRTPGFSILAILCLTLGIGANAAVFGWIEGILLRPFPGVDRGGTPYVAVSRPVHESNPREPVGGFVIGRREGMLRRQDLAGPDVGQGALGAGGCASTETSEKITVSDALASCEHTTRPSRTAP